MSDEWGPWIEHDGRGCPVAIGTIVNVDFEDGRSLICKACCNRRSGYVGPTVQNPRISAWFWAHPENTIHPFDRIIRYRIQKPRALLNLIEMVENLPTKKERERETA